MLPSCYSSNSNLTPVNLKGKPQNVWTDVDFTVEMAISDPILKVILDQMLREVALSQVLAFEKRCLETPYAGNVD